MQNTNFTAYEPDLDSKAFLYQQVTEIHQTLQGRGVLTVLCEKATDANGLESYAITLATPEIMDFSSRETGDSFVEAVLKAKHSLLGKLQYVLNAQSSPLEKLQQLLAATGPSGYLH